MGVTPMFKIGDRVRQRTDFSLAKAYGSRLELDKVVGTIVCFYRENPDYVGVEFPFLNGKFLHKLDNSLERNSGRWYRQEELEASSEEFNDDEWE